jgi:hypothetical protein
VNAADAEAARAAGRAVWGAGSVAGAAVVLVVAVYAGAFWALDALPYQDVPNHLSRAVAIADLLFDGGRRFGGTFAFDWAFVPYILGDLWHAATLVWLPPEAAARLWVFVAFAAFPAGAWTLLREWGASRDVSAAGAACAVFLAPDWFLQLGFLNFRYGLALALFATVAWERATARPTAGRVFAYAMLAVAAYLMHLSALVFLIAIVGTLSAVRVLRDPRTWRRYALAGLPLLAFLGWHLAAQSSAEIGAAVQPPAVTKVLRIAGALAPTRRPLLIAAALAFIAVVTLPLLRDLLRSRLRGWAPRALEALALAVAFAAVYLVLPEIKGKVWGVDIRALPFLWLFVAFATVQRLGSGAARRLAIGVAALALVELAALGTTLAPDNATMRRYREIAAYVPPGARVLAVVTRPRRGVVSPTAHAGSYAMIYADAVVPYTFTGNLDAPMPYFNFRARPPAFPWQWWYLNREPPTPSPRLLAGYDYLLIQQPVDWSRLPVTMQPVRGNEAVVLARVRPGPPARTANAARASR